jgi:hypothetical protein
MKLLMAIALVATSAPTLATSASARDGEGASREPRICTQAGSARAGSRMSPRRTCRTAAQWREALGPDWRQHLSGSTGTQDDYDAVQTRGTSYDGAGGVQPQSSREGPSPN